MWSLGIVVTAPLLNDDLGFFEAIEYLSVQQLIAEPRIEALAVTVLPGTAGLDIGGLSPNSFDPLPDGVCYELRPVIRTDVLWNAPQDEQIRKRIDHISRVQLPLYPDS